MTTGSYYTSASAPPDSVARRRVGRLWHNKGRGALVHVPQTLAHECLPRPDALSGPMVIHVKPGPVELRTRVVQFTPVSSNCRERPS